MSNEAARDESDESELLLLHKLRNTPDIFRRIAEHAGNEFQLQSQLREEYEPELVRAALTLCDDRKRAAAKFSRADQMWLTRVGLEQSTPKAVAQYKAVRFRDRERVVDLCCGIGGDAIAIAEHVPVTAVDISEAACLRTSWNAEVYGVQANIDSLVSDARTFDDTTAIIHVDPDRRAGRQKRSLRLEDGTPDLEWLQLAAARFRGGAFKLSPASNFMGKFTDVETELISLDGECKEATIWFGELAGQDAYRATVLPSDETISGDPMDGFPEFSEPQEFLFDPDPAVVRSGLVNLVAEKLSLARLDDAEEYLTGSERCSSPFVREFRVIESCANNNSEIRKTARRLEFGNVEIKCRHIPIQADAVRKKLKLGGKKPGVIVFARVGGQARVLMCERLR